MVNWKNIGGWAMFILAMVLYSSEQAWGYLGFSNIASQIIFSILCYILICTGIGLTVFEIEGLWKEVLVGVLSVFSMFMLCNAVLLIYDGAMNSWYYASTDYFYLLTNSYNLANIREDMALFLIIIALPLGLLLWCLISGGKMKYWYWVFLYAIIYIVLGTLFPFLNDIYVFGVF